MQLCQICQKNAATVHVTEISHYPVVEPGAAPEAEGEPAFEQKHVCDQCAARGKVPYSGVSVQAKSMVMLNMLKESARRVRKEGGVTCPDCGMTLAEFRSKGRLGCPRDYEIFRAHIDPLLLRIHNANRHRGRTPGVDENQRERQEHLTSLRARLEEAIQSEAYESAAELRDEIQQLED